VGGGEGGHRRFRSATLRLFIADAEQRMSVSAIALFQ
jgi:hypothetical protein